MTSRTENRVLGRVLARDLTERETESIGGADWGGGGGFGCPFGTFLTDVDLNGNPICDPGDGETP